MEKDKVIGLSVAGAVFAALAVVLAYKLGAQNQAVTIKIEGMPPEASTVMSGVMYRANADAAKIRSSSNVRQILTAAEMRAKDAGEFPASLDELDKVSYGVTKDVFVSPLTGTRYAYERHGTKLLVFEESSSGGNFGVATISASKDLNGSVDWYDSDAFAKRLADERK